MLYNKKVIRWTAKAMLMTLIFQLVHPALSYGLTSGPSQPEVQSFEPVGTTDMVDMFTGDFVYNIPLLDVEGYPVNISYHGGVDMEQEASWVGLGWNINPGVINRTVRGMPDDFKGEQIEKEMHIKEEKNFRIGTSLGVEPFGIASPIANLSGSIGGMLNMSNYRGVSVDITASAGVNLFGMVSAGVNMGIGSQSGADIDYNLGVSFGSSSMISTDVAGGVGFNMSHGYNTRTGLKDRSFSVSSSANMGGRNFRGPSFQTTVPIGVKNIIPVITNSTTMKAVYGQIKLGAEAAWSFGFGSVSAMISNLSYNTDGTRAGYGYLYSEHADDDDILDFTRDRDGMFNKSMHFLPPGNMTYDIYSVAGQGTGGSFRPFRNDFGSVYDPVTSSAAGNVSFNMDAGIGWSFQFGMDFSTTKTDITSGPWDKYKKPFRGRKIGSVYETSYFKQAGELTSVNSEYLNTIDGKQPGGSALAHGLPAIKPGSQSKRDPRANLIYYFTADEASRYGVASSQKIYSYNSTNGFASGPVIAKDSFNRVQGGRKGHSISEIVQVQTSGQRYVYGIPAMNNIQKEVTFSVEPPPAGINRDKGWVEYTPKEDSKSNESGLDHYFSNTVTPAYAHSYLLTSVLSTEYVDITGNGPTDDDFGSYTKFNYTRKNGDYRWRAPMESSEKMAQYNPGFRSDPKDDKGSYLAGSREQWILHSIETKNFVAEFYTSERADGKGATKGIAGPDYGTGTSAGNSYKLDSIKLFNKHDRFINTTAAVPVKTVFFKYHTPTDLLTLCKGITNGTTGAGKLTLARIYVRYGNSQKSMLSPYRFEYSSKNPAYNPADKDRWGAYKPNNTAFPNSDFPFVNQTDADLDQYASAWSLAKIHLPSGGTIETTYEADDYAYVQDKPAMEMFELKGVGISKVFMPMNQLFLVPQMPSSYFYFKRRNSEEQPGVSFRDQYLKGQNCLYYNIETWLAGNSFEPIKGYAMIEEVDACSDGIHGYVKVTPVKTKDGGATLNPAAYTAINFGRYHLPHIIFDGFQEDMNNIDKILSGLKQSFDELVGAAKSPVARLAGKGVGRNINLARSYIRLVSPGMKKKGGGHRVKRLAFYDNWAALAGGQEHTASYGKDYDYTIEKQGRRISSGVASYEPQIGGDENPFRVPVSYTAQSGSKWPPNDPVSLYQEMPIGESLYPSPIVGYSKVTVSSIHKEQGRSSQGIDIHDFYTAADFPLEVYHTPLEPIDNTQDFKFKHQVQRFQTAQGFTIVLNDMHGKPKRVENRVIKPASGVSELVSYQDYRYSTQGNKLQNTVPVLEYDYATGNMKQVSRQLGVEADVTIDTREKKEYTTSDNDYFNLNTSIIILVPVPIPLPIPWSGDYLNQFNSVVTTKVMQQYGILREVESYKEGAITLVRNEAFDPLTGQALITSVNNEYKKTEYTMNYPAWWAYKTMGAAYVNTGYEEVFDNMDVHDYVGILRTPTPENYRIGDELLITYESNGNVYEENAWVYGFGSWYGVWLHTGMSPDGPTEEYRYYPMGVSDLWPLDGNAPPPVFSSGPCYPFIKPRFKYQAKWPEVDTFRQVKIKILRSGAKNQLSDIVQSYTSLKNPVQGDSLKNVLSDLVRISATEYSDFRTAKLPRYLVSDSLNEFLNGVRQVNRPYKEYSYIRNRDYGGMQSQAGVFSAFPLWRSFKKDPDCGMAFSELNGSYLKMQPLADKNWVVSRTITKWSPWGPELENRDAIGNYSSAIYGYNNALPVAIAQNARQHEILSDGFEDYSLLQVLSNWVTMNFSIFRQYFSLASIGTSMFAKYDLAGNTSAYSISADASHSGKYALKTGSSATLTIPVRGPVEETGPLTYLPFTLEMSKEYLVSYWFRPVSPSANLTSYTLPSGMKFKSNIIDGWQQVERTISSGGTYTLTLPANAYIDDIRIIPVTANMKAYVYHPFNQKLVATLDENNFATFYEYDQEGNLIRTKKETEQGIITLSESRSGTTQK